MLDKNAIATWRSLKGGDIITLTDEQTIADLMDDQTKNAMRGIDLTIGCPEAIKHQNGDFELIIYPLEGYKQDMWLMVKSVDEDFDLRIYYEPADFERGNRAELIDKGYLWLFQEPAEPDSAIPSELKHALYIENTDPETDEQIIFRSKAQTSFGESISLGEDPIFVQITEYLAEDEHKNPELMTIEYGGLDEDGDELDEGGYIKFFQGETIQPSSIDIMPMTYSPG